MSICEATEECSEAYQNELSGALVEALSLILKVDYEVGGKGES